LLDEFGAVERDIEYSFMFEVMRKIQVQWAPQSWHFFILMCKATMSDRLTEAMDLLCPSKVEFPKRPYPLERYQVEMESLPVPAMCDAMAKCVIALLRSGRTVLVFLPGQDEIGSVNERITSAGTGPTIR
jgi:HrpA-like RNA helicase